MIKKYSVQFERCGDNGSSKLLGSLIKLGDSFCEYFPVTTSTGYVFYQNLPVKNNHAAQDFWFAVVEAPDEVEAYQEAFLTLVSANLEEPFPAQLRLTYDREVREF